ncbi:IS21 family transposase [Rickettsia endosymbiont of Urophora cardui]|uniref:IS21 family transposase n=1 Tax=Rickettsia endosymbiont of Urophora cardui TaxID=3066265 RepID=UPI00313C4EF9
MTCTNNQVGILMQKIKKYNQIISAAKAGMSVKTARKYLRINKYPSELRTIRKYRTRKDPFVKHWDEIESMLESAPELQATTILAYLTEKYHGNYNGKQLRCLQKRLKQWRAAHGKDKTVIFLQNILPGKQSQSDWTNMNQLGICSGGQPYPHLLFHFMLPYSCWETFSICHSESFDTLASGFEKAVWELGGVLPEHRTDNLSAATKQCGNSRQFTERWQELLGYYNVAPSRNNPGVSHENGSVEKSHDTFKQAVNQHLLWKVL